MVNIDTVYQRVLALANKEQRGYITPQDFNLFANQAQMEIFEQYFYDVNMARKGQGNDTVYADIDDMLEQKLQIFERVADSSTITGWGGDPGARELPISVYKVFKVMMSASRYGILEAEILNTKDYTDAINAGYLIKPNRFHPAANISANIIRSRTGGAKDAEEIYYFVLPSKVNWGYIVMNDQAMYNDTTSVHFELHRSEETQLVNKILKLAGISIKQQDVAQSGQGMEASTIQQQPKI